MKKEIIDRSIINLYWPIYKNLENEVVLLASQIHFDDGQLKVYSSKITELIIRCAIEVESISKELYFKYGGEKADNNNLKFDYDCLKFLEEKWALSKKLVFLTSPHFHFEKKDNKIITPLLGLFEDPKSGKKTPWLQAYQSIKHNRAKNLENGNVKNLIHAMAGLFLLNLYYKNSSFYLGQDFNYNFLEDFSLLFDIKIYSFQGFNRNGTYKKTPIEFDCSTYIPMFTENFKKRYIDFCIERGKISYKFILEHQEVDISIKEKLTQIDSFDLSLFLSKFDHVDSDKVNKIHKDIQKDAQFWAIKKMNFNYNKELMYQAELNKDQEYFVATKDAGKSING